MGLSGNIMFSLTYFEIIENENYNMANISGKFQAF